jgi:hypothetical protein
MEVCWLGTKSYGRNQRQETLAHYNGLVAKYRKADSRVRRPLEDQTFYQEALRIQRKVLGAEHPETATTLNNLGELYQDAGEYDKAEPFLIQRSGSGKRSLDWIIPTPPRASTTWRCCTKQWETTPKPNRFFGKRSGSAGRSLGQKVPTPLQL